MGSVGWQHQSFTMAHATEEERIVAASSCGGKKKREFCLMGAEFSSGGIKRI